MNDGFHRLFDRQGLSLDRLRSFLRVADAGGIARAAPGKPTQQSQIHRQIRELEAFFGKALIERRGRTVTLTEAGRRLAVVSREAFHGLHDFTLEETSAPMRFELGAGDSVLHWWIVPRLGDALARLPQVQLSLTSLSSLDIVARLLDARLDVGVVRASAVSRALPSRALGSIEYAFFVPRRWRALSPAQVLTEVPLALQVSEPEPNACLRTLAKREPKVALTCETFPQACRAVRSGRYASLLPVLARSELPASEFLELRAPELQRAATKLVLAWHPRLVRQRSAADAVLDALESALRIPR